MLINMPDLAWLNGPSTSLNNLLHPMLPIARIPKPDAALCFRLAEPCEPACCVYFWASGQSEMLKLNPFGDKGPAK